MTGSSPNQCFTVTAVVTNAAIERHRNSTAICFAITAWSTTKNRNPYNMITEQELTPLPNSDLQLEEIMQEFNLWESKKDDDHLTQLLRASIQLESRKKQLMRYRNEIQEIDEKINLYLDKIRTKLRIIHGKVNKIL